MTIDILEQANICQDQITTFERKLKLISDQHDKNKWGHIVWHVESEDERASFNLNKDEMEVVRDFIIQERDAYVAQFNEL